METSRRLLPLGRVAGHRGRSGEITVRIFRGEAEFWTGLDRVWLGSPDGDDGSFYSIERSRAYRDRLVLKLEGVDDATVAGSLRGRRVAAPAESAPQLPPGEHYTALLVGLEVRDEEGRVIGTVVDVAPTGGADLLVIVPGGPAEGEPCEDEEILVPLAEGIVEEVDEDGGFIRIRPPEGLLDRNR
jgi:16S rRNA processing protein RimM